MIGTNRSLNVEYALCVGRRAGIETIFSLRKERNRPHAFGLWSEFVFALLEV